MAAQAGDGWMNGTHTHTHTGLQFFLRTSNRRPRRVVAHWSVAQRGWNWGVTRMRPTNRANSNSKQHLVFSSHEERIHTDRERERIIKMTHRTPATSTMVDSNSLGRGTGFGQCTPVSSALASSHRTNFFFFLSVWTIDRSGGHTVEKWGGEKNQLPPV